MFYLGNAGLKKLSKVIFRMTVWALNLVIVIATPQTIFTKFFWQSPSMPGDYRNKQQTVLPQTKESIGMESVWKWGNFISNLNTQDSGNRHINKYGNTW